MIEDRSMLVQPNQTVKVDWVDVNACVLGSNVPLAPEAVEKKWRKLLQQGDAASWPPLVGHWTPGGRFVVDDGRHELIATIMRGRRQVLVCWLEDKPA